MKDACIFCEIIDGRQPKSTVYEDHQFIVIMDIFPMTEGHCIVIPKHHGVRVHDLPRALRGRLFDIAVQVRCAVTSSVLGCDDANYIINDGKHANQEVPHVHLHVIPRRRRDHARLLRSMLRKALLGRIRKVDYATLDAQAEKIRGELRI
jgi:histidine triad (HIT) family protein